MMPEIREGQVIQNLIIQIFLEKKKPLPEYLIHKILFKFKMAIENRYPTLSDSLQYYWYKHGPYFEDVASVMNNLRSEGILSAEPIKHPYKKGFIYSLNAVKLGFQKSTLSPVELDDLRKVILSVDELEGGEFNKELYANYGPYKFQSLYKQTYLELFNELHFKERPFNKTDISKLKNILIDCEAELIPDPLFEEFNDLFASYCTIAYRIFNYYRGKGSNPYYFDKMEYVTNMIWDVFADGLRILAHTPRFGSRVDEWKAIFKKDLLSLKESLRTFIFNVDDNFDKEGYPMVSRDRPKEILGVVIDSYSS